MVIEEEEFILRLRDNCALFNPKTYLEANRTDDSAANMGIRMVLAAAKDVSYISAFELNNLIIRL